MIKQLALKQIMWLLVIAQMPIMAYQQQFPTLQSMRPNQPVSVVGFCKQFLRAPVTSFRKQPVASFGLSAVVLTAMGIGCYYALPWLKQWYAGKSIKNNQPKTPNNLQQDVIDNLPMKIESLQDYIVMIQNYAAPLALTIDSLNENHKELFCATKHTLEGKKCTLMDFWVSKSQDSKKEEMGEKMLKETLTALALALGSVAGDGVKDVKSPTQEHVEKILKSDVLSLKEFESEVDQLQQLYKNNADYFYWLAFLYDQAITEKKFKGPLNSIFGNFYFNDINGVDQTIHFNSPKRLYDYFVDEQSESKDKNIQALVVKATKRSDEIAKTKKAEQELALTKKSIEVLDSQIKTLESNESKNEDDKSEDDKSKDDTSKKSQSPAERVLFNLAEEKKFEDIYDYGIRKKTPPDLKYDLVFEGDDLKVAKKVLGQYSSNDVDAEYYLVKLYKFENPNLKYDVIVRLDTLIEKGYFRALWDLINWATADSDFANMLDQKKFQEYYKLLTNEQNWMIVGFETFSDAFMYELGKLDRDEKSRATVINYFLQRPEEVQEKYLDVSKKNNPQLRVNLKNRA